MKISDKNAFKYQLYGRTALITSSTRGIGWAIVRGMAMSGATVFVNGRDKDVLEQRYENLIDFRV